LTSGNDAQRYIGNRLYESNRLGKNGGLVRERDACINIQYVRTRRDLCNGVRLDATVIADFHLLGQELAAGRVDTFTNDGKRSIKADYDFLRL
jgi:hypothetical protein